MNVNKIVASLPQRTVQEREVMRDRARQMAASTDPAKAAAGTKVLNGLDEIEKSEADALIEHVRSLPKARRVVEAFSSPHMSETERAVVQVLLDNPSSTSSELSAALGWKAQSWHMHFGTMCFNRRARLWPAPPAEKRDAAFYSGILAELDADGSRFTMGAEAAEGFAALGLHAAAPKSSRA